AKPSANPSVSISRRLDRVLAQPFAPAFRASRPRGLQAQASVAASLAGVPEELRPRIGRGIQSTAFPYPRFVRGEGGLEWTDLDVVELENARWQVAICPGLGGRIVRVFDRRARRELLLQSPVLSQGVIGLSGAW